MTKGRLEAFSDGVIAIIITITILEIGLPEGNDMRAHRHSSSGGLLSDQFYNGRHELGQSPPPSSGGRLRRWQNIVGKPSLPLRPVLPACSNRLGRQILICNASGQSILLAESCGFFELCPASEAHHQRA